MRRILTTIPFVLALAACGQPDADREAAATAESAAPVETAAAEAAQTESERLNAWFEAKYEELLQFSPLQLAFIGRKDLYDQVDDASEEAEDEQLAWRRASVEEMEREFDYAKLTPEAQISYDLWKYQYEEAAANREFRGSAYTFHQMQGVQAIVPVFMMNFHRVDEPADMEAYAKRISEFGRVVNQLISRAQKYAENGVRPPRFAYEGVLQQAQAVVTGEPFTEGPDSALWGDAQRKAAALVEAGKITEEQAAEMTEAVKTALVADLKPAYLRLVAWVEADMPNTDEVGRGVSELPDGEAYYNRRLASSTTTNMTADEVHELGLSEVARLRAEMEAIREKVGFEGDLQAFFAYMRDDQKFFFPSTDEGREAYLETVNKDLAFINERLPEYFGVLPKAELVVKRVEPFREQDGGPAHYMSGTADGSRPGIYYVHLSDMSANPKPMIEVIAYHEGNPGHHMQQSIARELEGVPTFRTQAQFTAYAEGWGLYAELLAKEMGAYQDPYSDFGRLRSEMWRALRLVVDTGLHAKGWTDERATSRSAAARNRSTDPGSRPSPWPAARRTAPSPRRRR